jgi:hypothetical protein
MAKKSEASPKGKSAGARKLLEAAKKHQNELSAAVIERYENALSGVDNESKGPSVAAQTLIKDIGREVGEFHSAIRKEFPGNASFHALFKAGEPLPTDARGILALGRLVQAEAPNFASNFIRYAINAATVKHLGFLCEQLEKEIGGADPKHDAAELEKQIREAARHAFEGKPELADFGG